MSSFDADYVVPIAVTSEESSAPGSPGDIMSTGYHRSVSEIGNTTDGSLSPSRHHMQEIANIKQIKTVADTVKQFEDLVGDESGLLAAEQARRIERERLRLKEDEAALKKRERAELIRRRREEERAMDEAQERLRDEEDRLEEERRRQLLEQQLREEEEARAEAQRIDEELERARREEEESIRRRIAAIERQLSAAVEEEQDGRRGVERAEVSAFTIVREIADRERLAVEDAAARERAEVARREREAVRAAELRELKALERRIEQERQAFEAARRAELERAADEEREMRQREAEKEAILEVRRAHMLDQQRLLVTAQERERTRELCECERLAMVDAAVVGAALMSEEASVAWAAMLRTMEGEYRALRHAEAMAAIAEERRREEARHSVMMAQLLMRRRAEQETGLGELEAEEARRRAEEAQLRLQLVHDKQERERVIAEALAENHEGSLRRQSRRLAALEEAHEEEQRSAAQLRQQIKAAEAEQQRVTLVEEERRREAAERERAAEEMARRVREVADSSARDHELFLMRERAEASRRLLEHSAAVREGQAIEFARAANTVGALVGKEGERLLEVGRERALLAEAKNALLDKKHEVELAKTQLSAILYGGLGAEGRSRSLTGNTVGAGASVSRSVQSPRRDTRSLLSGKNIIISPRREDSGQRSHGSFASRTTTHNTDDANTTSYSTFKSAAASLRNVFTPIRVHTDQILSRGHATNICIHTGGQADVTTSESSFSSLRDASDVYDENSPPVGRRGTPQGLNLSDEPSTNERMVLPASYIKPTGLDITSTPMKVNKLPVTLVLDNSSAHPKKGAVESKRLELLGDSVLPPPQYPPSMVPVRRPFPHELPMILFDEYCLFRHSSLPGGSVYGRLVLVSGGLLSLLGGDGCSVLETLVRQRGVRSGTDLMLPLVGVAGYTVEGGRRGSTELALWPQQAASDGFDVDVAQLWAVLGQRGDCLARMLHDCRVLAEGFVVTFMGGDGMQRAADLMRTA